MLHGVKLEQCNGLYSITETACYICQDKFKVSWKHTVELYQHASSKRCPRDWRQHCKPPKTESLPPGRSRSTNQEYTGRIEVLADKHRDQGIGYEIIKALLQSTKPYRIFLGSRSIKNADDAITKLKQEFTGTNTIEPLQVDLQSDQSIEDACKKLDQDPGYLDTLVNNAGKCAPYWTIVKTD